MFHGILLASASMTCHLDCFDNGVFKRIDWGVVCQFAAFSLDAAAMGSTLFSGGSTQCPKFGA